MGAFLPPLQFPVWLLTPKLPSTNNSNRNAPSSKSSSALPLKSTGISNPKQQKIWRALGNTRAIPQGVLNLSQPRFSFHTTRAARKDEAVLFASQNTHGELSSAGIWFMPRSVVINIQIHVCVWGSFHSAGLTMARCCVEEIFSWLVGSRWEPRNKYNYYDDYYLVSGRGRNG